MAISLIVTLAITLPFIIVFNRAVTKANVLIE